MADTQQSEQDVSKLLASGADKSYTRVADIKQGNSGDGKSHPLSFPVALLSYVSWRPLLMERKLRRKALDVESRNLSFANIATAKKASTYVFH